MLDSGFMACLEQEVLESFYKGGSARKDASIQLCLMLTSGVCNVLVLDYILRYNKVPEFTYINDVIDYGVKVGYIDSHETEMAFLSQLYLSFGKNMMDSVAETEDYAYSTIGLTNYMISLLESKDTGLMYHSSYEYSLAGIIALPKFIKENKSRLALGISSGELGMIDCIFFDLCLDVLSSVMDILGNTGIGGVTEEYFQKHMSRINEADGAPEVIDYIYDDLVEYGGILQKAADIRSFTINVNRSND